MKTERSYYPFWQVVLVVTFSPQLNVMCITASGAVSEFCLGGAKRRAKRRAKRAENFSPPSRIFWPPPTEGGEVALGGGKQYLASIFREFMRIIL